MEKLPAQVMTWIDAHAFATIGTNLPNGYPHLSIVWIAYDGDDLLVSTVKGRRKHRNIEADNRVSVLISPQDNPYQYAEIRGTATMTEEGGRELIDSLCREYTGADRYTMDDGTDNVRIVVRIAADKVVLRA